MAAAAMSSRTVDFVRFFSGTAKNISTIKKTLHCVCVWELSPNFQSRVERNILGVLRKGIAE